MTDLQWEKLTDERGAAPPEGQGDLFDAALPVVASAPDVAATDGKKSAPSAPQKGGYLGLPVGKKWF